MSRRAVALLLALLLPACYSYVPLESGDPKAGQDVRVHLTDRAEREVGYGMGAGDDTWLTGLVLRSGGDSLTLSASGEWQPGVASAFRRDTVTLARSHIRSIDRSEMDATRTAILAGLGVGAVAAAVILVANANPDGSGAGGGGGTPRNSEVPFVQIPLRIP